MKTFTTLLALLATSANAHFLLNYPTSIGFSDDDEGTAPCGGFTPDFATDNVTDFYVGGDNIALQSTHPAAFWLFRATLDQTAAGNWSQLTPTVSQEALGLYCQQNVQVPSTWAGQKGIISVVQDAVDGLLYQCAAVNFVAGPSTSVPSTCTNATNVVAVFSADSALSAIATATSSAASGTGAATTTTSGASAASSTSAAATILVGSYSGVSSLIWVGMATSAAFLAFVL